ncbi:ABC transporter permease [Nocardiopsis quinghaiensis]|uniref:ABC transporter permease n=1 Tax=Nocardiopsis quinghaiensis TaxID=464995 RepID=UPI001238CAF5|nr:ABC transporter permease [Nocardiopsis quinghaiensis]
MRVIAAITAKDLRQRLKDGSLLLFGLVLPLGMAFLFAHLLGDGPGDGLDIRYLVVDSDGGGLGGVFVDDVLRPLDEDGVISLEEAADTEEAEHLVEEGEADAAFLLPQGFSDTVAGGDRAVIEIVGSADSAVQVQIAREIADSFAVEADASRTAVLEALEAGADETPEALSQRVREQPAPLSLVDDTTADWRELDTATYYAAGLAYFFLFFVVMSSVTGILDERRDGTLARLLAAPVRRSAILAGKSLSATIVGAAGLFVLAAVSSLVLGSQWGPLPGVAALVVSGTLAAVGITAAVVTFSSSSEQATNRISVVAFGLGLLGGGLFPVAQLGALSVLSFATPHRWFLHGLAELGGGSFAAVLVPVLVLSAMAVVTGALSLFRLGRMLNA